SCGEHTRGGGGGQEVDGPGRQGKLKGSTSLPGWRNRQTQRTSSSFDDRCGKILRPQGHVGSSPTPGISPDRSRTPPPGPLPEAERGRRPSSPFPLREGGQGG